MAGREDEIRKSLQAFVKRTGGPNVSMLATVKDVNEEEGTCTLYDTDTELEYFDVRLKPVVDDKECILVIPKVNTWALAVRIEDDNDWLIVSIGEAAKIKYKCNAILFNEGENGGIPKVNPLVSDINDIKQDLNELKNLIASWVVAPGDGGGALKIALASWYAASIALTTVENIENSNVKH